MPRVSIKRKEYKASDLTKYIVGKMYEVGMNQIDLAKALNVTQQSISYKMRQNAWTYKELLTIFDFLKVSDTDILKIMKM